MDGEGAGPGVSSARSSGCSVGAADVDRDVPVPSPPSVPAVAPVVAVVRQAPQACAVIRDGNLQDWPDYYSEALHQYGLSNRINRLLKNGVVVTSEFSGYDSPREALRVMVPSPVSYTHLRAHETSAHL
eukprot:11186851-Alexandrium_andersonii.AAC.1